MRPFGPERLRTSVGCAMRTETSRQQRCARRTLQRIRSRHGFTLVELVMIIVLLGILSAVAYSKWPTGMKEEAARLELKRAFRYAQHLAITREYTTAAAAWGLVVSGNRYTVERADGTEKAGADYRDRSLLGDSAITLSGPAVRFNGLGEPIDSTGTPLAAGGTYTVAGSLSLSLTFCPETGYVQEGTTCP